MNENSAEYEQLVARIKAEIVQDLAKKKKTESEWMKVRKEIEEQARLAFGNHNKLPIVMNGLGALGRIIFDKHPQSFKGSEADVIRSIFSDLLAVAVKYKETAE